MLCHEYFEGCCVVIRCEVLPTQLPGEAPLYAKLRQGQTCQTGHGMHMRLGYHTRQQWNCHGSIIEVLFQLFQDLQQARQFDCTSCRTQGDFEHRFSCFRFVTLTEFQKDQSIFGAGSNHIWEQPAFAESTEFSAERLSSRSKTTLVP